MEHPNLLIVSVNDGCVKVSGEVDSLTAPELLDAVLRSALCEVDLSEVSFMDSGGLHALIQLRAECEGFRIVAMSRVVQRLLDMTAMSEHLLGRHGDSAA